MGLSMLIDFGIFLFLLVTLVGLIFAKTISILNRIYVSLHLAFMLWAFLQFAASTTATNEYRYLFVKLSYVSLILMGVVILLFTLYITKQNSFLKSLLSKLAILPALAAIVFILINPNQFFLKINLNVDSAKTFINGEFFIYVVGLILLYVITSLYLLCKYYFNANHESMARAVSRFAILGIGIILLFGTTDFIVNILFLNWLPQYVPIMSIGMLIAGTFMFINVNRIHVLDMISLAQRDVMNLISVGILVLDRDWKIVEKNTFVDQFIQQKVGERLHFSSLRDNIKEPNWQRMEAMIKEREDDPYVQLEEEWIIINPYLHLNVQSFPILDKQSAIIGYMYTFQDLTEINHLTDSLKRQNLLLQQRNSELLKAQEELYDANRKLEKIAITDALTECYNRRYLMHYLEHELAKNIEKQLPFTIMIFDLDYFKLINDAYGHLNGDIVLQQTAKKVEGLLGPDDRLARYGGEEFIIYFPQLTIFEAHLRAERIKNEVEHQQIWLEDIKDHVSVTISVGLMTIEHYDEFLVKDSKVFLQEVMQLADTALYEAKFKGRNNIVNRSSGIG